MRHLVTNVQYIAAIGMRRGYDDTRANKRYLRMKRKRERPQAKKIVRLPILSEGIGVRNWGLKVGKERM